MQYTDKKSLYFRKVLGEVIEELRNNNANQTSRNRFSAEYGLNDSNLGKIERAIVDCKFVTLWKIIEALDIDIVEFMKIFKNKQGNDFKFIDE